MPSARVSPTPSQVSAARQGAWDRLGTLLSGLCLVHCLLLPAALLVLPGFALLHAVHETAHLVLALLLLPITYAALQHRSHGDRSHGGRKAAAAGKELLLAGVVLVWLALPLHALLGVMAETAATVLGSLALVAGHVSHLVRRSN